MAVKIRLKRMGAKKSPFYRIVVADSRSPRDGRFIESVGTYNPVAQPAKVELNEELVLKWLNDGAKPSDTVRNLFSKQGIMEKFHNSKLREEAAIMMSCKASIKANHHLRNDEIQALLDELRRSSDPFTCPHGRPIIVHYSTYEMEKMFKRVM